MGILDKFDGKDALLAANLATSLQQGSSVLKALNSLADKVDTLQQSHDSLIENQSVYSQPLLPVEDDDNNTPPAFSIGENKLRRLIVLAEEALQTIAERIKRDALADAAELYYIIRPSIIVIRENEEALQNISDIRACQAVLKNFTGCANALSPILSLTDTIYDLVESKGLSIPDAVTQDTAKRIESEAPHPDGFPLCPTRKEPVVCQITNPLRSQAIPPAYMAAIIAAIGVFFCLYGHYFFGGTVILASVIYILVIHEYDEDIQKERTEVAAANHANDQEYHAELERFTTEYKSCFLRYREQHLAFVDQLKTIKADWKKALHESRKLRNQLLSEPMLDDAARQITVRHKANGNGDPDKAKNQLTLSDACSRLDIAAFFTVKASWWRAIRRHSSLDNEAQFNELMKNKILSVMRDTYEIADPESLYTYLTDFSSLHVSEIYLPVVSDSYTFGRLQPDHDALIQLLAQLPEPDTGGKLLMVMMAGKFIGLNFPEFAAIFLNQKNRSDWLSAQAKFQKYHALFGESHEAGVRKLIGYSGLSAVAYLKRMIELQQHHG